MTEKNILIALPGKGGLCGLFENYVSLKTMCLNTAGFDEEFYNNSTRVGLLVRLGCVRACSPLIWSQVIFIFKFFGHIVRHVGS